MTRSSGASKEIDVAGDYLMKLLNGKMKFSVKQVDLFKHIFNDVLSKRFMGHWFPDPGEVTIRFGEEGTTCVLYSKHTQELYGGSDGEDDRSSSSSEDDSNIIKDLQSLTITDDTLSLNNQKLKSGATASPILTSFTRNMSSLSSRGPSPSASSISSNDSTNTTSVSQPRRQPQPLFIPTYSFLQSDIVNNKSASSNLQFLNYPYEQQSNIDYVTGPDDIRHQNELFENLSVNSYINSNSDPLPTNYNLQNGFYNPSNWHDQSLQQQQQFWPQTSTDYSFMYNTEGRY
ncbi:unnamed protein product [Didymodactylos carnosus]|uniref:Anti-proliferative protein domain-containing protein n=1 Tax=Didymodactylos carnosus TaxID=1234261 RepID=A0A813QSU9_9BILA|nr:unnamed protein product [Didymodactylos carnosus]CAF0921181.1 unnamed protein product [Didymodactylos carnosus]CAF3553712.1 unnamed protein product [Didymodactylos carnosus]CAF3698604.1 unnamed protein product [Didymodactylos carnosus]